MSCSPFIQLALVLKVYDWSLRNRGFQPSGLPSVENPVIFKGGMPLSRGSGPLVPGIPRISEPKLVPRSGGFTSCPNRVQPSVPSIRNVGETVYVCPIPAICTSVSPVPSPPPAHKQLPPAWPIPKSPCTSAFMALYLNHSRCLSLRFQLTFTSKLLRFRR